MGCRPEEYKGLEDFRMGDQLPELERVARERGVDLPETYLACKDWCEDGDYSAVRAAYRIITDLLNLKDRIRPLFS